MAPPPKPKLDTYKPRTLTYEDTMTLDVGEVLQAKDKFKEAKEKQENPRENFRKKNC